jgi:hypothetical protein
MCRTAFVVLVLAALSSISANGSPVPTAKTHKFAPAAAVSHNSQKKTLNTTAHEAGHAAGRKLGHSAAPPFIGIETASASPHKAKGIAPPPLRGSRESLARQNEKSDDEGLERIEDEDDLRDRIARKMLVPVPVSAKLAVSEDLLQDHRYCRPWAAVFLSDLARAHATQYPRPLMISSAVRTVEYQKQLMEINGNAAAAEGDIVSPHVTGATVDIAKHGLSRQEVGWLRRWLLPLQTAGKIDVEEEFQQACFHITIYKSYAPPKPAPARKPSRKRPAPPAQIASRGR